MPLGEAGERPGKYEAGACDGIALPQDEMGGEVSRGPARDQRRCVGSEHVEEGAERKALLGVQRKIRHVPMVLVISVVDKEPRRERPSRAVRYRP